MTASAPPSADTWVYDHAASVFFHPVSNTYAVPDPVSGQWSYIPASDFLGAESSARARSQGANESSLAQSGSTGAAGDAVEGEKEEREEGEIEDDVGWGGLMEPEQLQAVLKTRNPIHTVPGSTTLSTRPQSNALEKHPAYTAAYDDPKLYAYPSQTQLEPADPPTATPTHILRLVVQESKVLTPGQVVIIDARQGGIQLGRDRCERGAQARMRLREMEVSKTHAVVYHGQKGDTDLRELDQQGDSAWWIVDLGSTHGTFLLPPSSSQSQSDPKKNKKDRTRLSEPKHSSQPYRLSHLSQIIVGSTTLIAHIHPSWPCNLCQLSGTNEILLDDGETKSINTATPYVAAAASASAKVDGNGTGNGCWNVAMTSQQKRDNREINRKREMKLLRETLLNRNKTPAPVSAFASTAAAAAAGDTKSDNETPTRGYLDRSAMRRRLHPPSPPQPRHSGTAPQPISTNTATSAIIAKPPEKSASTTFAASFMANQGWQAGQGLGRDGAGRAEPIAAEARTAKRGLGAQGSKAVVDSGEGDWRQRGKRRRWDELAQGHV